MTFTIDKEASFGEMHPASEILQGAVLLVFNISG
jgi:hypothetical protein